MEVAQSTALAPSTPQTTNPAPFATNSLETSAEVLSGGAATRPTPTSPSPEAWGAQPPSPRAAQPSERAAGTASHPVPTPSSTAPGGRRWCRGPAGPKAAGGAGGRTGRSGPAAAEPAGPGAVGPPDRPHPAGASPQGDRATASARAGCPAPSASRPPPRACPRAQGLLPGARARQRAEGGGSGGGADWLAGVPRGRGRAARGRREARDGGRDGGGDGTWGACGARPLPPRPGFPVRRRGGREPPAATTLSRSFLRRKVKRRETCAASPGLWDGRDPPARGAGRVQAAPGGRPALDHDAPPPLPPRPGTRKTRFRELGGHRSQG